MNVCVRWITIQCELKKKETDIQSLISQNRKGKKDCYQWMVAYLFFFHMVHWSFILGQGWLLSNNFCKACQNCLRPSSVIVHNAVRMHELLLCCGSSRICHHAAQTQT